LLARFERILARYEPAVFVLEAFDGDEARRIERVCALCRDMMYLAACNGAKTPVFGRTAVRAAFEPLGASTRYEIAQVIAQQIEPLSHRLPHHRKPWLAQDPRQSLFDAAALALTYFARIGEN
jgi:hypothetical protein